MSRVLFYDLAAVNRSVQVSVSEAIDRVVSSGQFILGSETAAFEEEFAQYCEVTHCVGVGNGLDALKIGLLALGIRPGDEVLVPGQTFIATWLAVSEVGAIPVPVDVILATGQIDVEAARVAITDRTTAIVAVHLFGSFSPVDQLGELARSAGIALVEDAAQAHGATWDGHKPGTGSAFAAYSFYPAKNLGAYGDGGAIVTDDPSLAATARKLRNYGSARKYDHDALGFNSRLDEIQAAILRAKLPHLDDWNRRRRELVHRYCDLLAGCDEISLPTVNSARELPACHIMPIRVADRAILGDAFARNEIDYSIHYPVSPGDSPAYRNAGIAQVELPNSRIWARDEISLPLTQTMTTQEQDRVVDVLSLHFGRARFPC
jgi:dTDP-3-amino-3,4,6-trideoxy-alpha-D-glucose transaminase